MAVYKPTDCSPFGGSFDISPTNSDLPIFFECKVDTSNTKVTGYSIEIYDSENKKVFPVDDTASLEDRITLVNDLRLYFEANYADFSVGYKLLNSGINGSYLKIPFFKTNDQQPTSSDYHNTVSRNQYNGETSISNGNKYMWNITLYQEVAWDITTIPNNVRLPSDAKYYDMTLTSGQIIGSNEKRIQTAPVDGSVVLVDKYIQTVRIDGLNVDDDKPKEWTAAAPISITPVSQRVLVENYNDTYGYIYPTTVGSDTFSAGQISESVVNGFQIYKNGNNPDNLGATDKVLFVFDGAIFEDTNPGNPHDSEWVWHEMSANQSNSYWEEKYVTTSDPKEGVYPLDEATRLSGNERIIFNHFMKGAAVSGSNYDGSPYNGIYYPQISYQEEIFYNETQSIILSPGPVTIHVVHGINSSFTPAITVEGTTMKPENIVVKNPHVITFTWPQAGSTGLTNITVKYLSEESIITVRWSRTTDADTWGELLNKVVYVENGTIGGSGTDQIIMGQNAEITIGGTSGILNSTPFKFVSEKPVVIYEDKNSSEEDRPASDQEDYILVSTNDEIQSIVSITYNGVVLQQSNYSYSVGGKNIYIINTEYVGGENVTINYKKYSENNTTGIIFYNRPAKLGRKGKLYIRPFANVRKKMMLATIPYDEQKNISIENINQDYWFIKYSEPVETVYPIDTRYQIKTFYRESDYNQFGIYNRPEFTTTFKYIDGDTFNISETRRRDFKCSVSYSQENYIMWESYQFILYKSHGGMIEKTVTQTGEIHDGEISFEFYGLDKLTDGWKYVLQLIIKTNTGAIVTDSYDINTENIEDEESPLPSSTAIVSEYNDSTRSIDITIGDLGLSSGSHYIRIYRREIWYDEFDGEEGTARSGEWRVVCKNFPYSGSSGNTYSDYGIMNHRTYEYLISVDDTTNYIVSHKTNWTGSSIVELHKPKDDVGITYMVEPKDVWLFKYNISDSAETQNIVKTQQETLSLVPRFSCGPANYMSGQMQCLLGREILCARYTNKTHEYMRRPTTGTHGWKERITPDWRNVGGYIESLSRTDIWDNRYTSAESLGFKNLSSNESADMLKAWREICYSGNPKLLKDEKGNGYIIQIINPSNTTNTSWDRMPISVSFDWVEIEKIEKIDEVDISSITGVDIV